jgi:hypothetical protein
LRCNGSINPTDLGGGADDGKGSWGLESRGSGSGCRTNRHGRGLLVRLNAALFGYGFRVVEFGCSPPPPENESGAGEEGGGEDED